MLGVCRAALALVPEKLATQGARRQDRTAAPKVKVLLTLLGREGGGEWGKAQGFPPDRGWGDRCFLAGVIQVVGLQGTKGLPHRVNGKIIIIKLLFSPRLCSLPLNASRVPTRTLQPPQLF